VTYPIIDRDERSGQPVRFRTFCIAGGREGEKRGEREGERENRVY
jgi:hypothetical protein